MGNSKRYIVDQDRVFRSLHFANLGFRDYIGARILLLNRLPLQGAILGSSAVEKYIKSLLSTRGENVRGHLKTAHVSSLRNYMPDLFNKLSIEFLEFLKKCYKMRYTDRLPINFNLSVYARETLAELDHTIFCMEHQLTFRKADGSLISTMYQSAATKLDPRLFTENHVLQQVDKADFLKKSDIAFGVRNRPIHGLLEIDFTANTSPSDGKFCREAVAPIFSGKDE